MKIEKLSNNRVKFTFEVSKEEFAHGLDHAFEHIKENVEVKGFRKGHVTRKVYESKFGVESLYEEALNHVLHHKYHEILQNKDYQVVGNPTPVLNFEDVGVDKSFEVALEVPVKPEVKLGKYKNIELEKLSSEVTDEEVSAEVLNLLNQNVVLEPKTEGVLENGNTAVFDYEGFADNVPFEGGKAENFELEIGSGQFIPGFEEQMVGMKQGEEKEINITFPEQYHSEDLAGKDAIFKIKLHDIKQKSTVDLTDEWVVSLGKEEKTVEELKANIKANIQKNKEANNKNQLLDQALKAIAQNTNVDIPEEMIDYEVEKAFEGFEGQIKQYGLTLDQYLQMSGMTVEQIKEQYRTDSEIRVLNSLLIEAVAKAEKFEVSNEEIEAKYEEIAKMYQMELAEVKKHLNNEMLKQDIEFTKAIDFIYDNILYK